MSRILTLRVLVKTPFNVGLEALGIFSASSVGSPRYRTVKRGTISRPSITPPLDTPVIFAVSSVRPDMAWNAIGQGIIQREAELSK